MPNKKRGTHSPATGHQLDAMRVELEVLRSKVYAAKIAYLNHTPFQDREVTFEDLKAFAGEYIHKSYDYQKAVYGRIKVRISVAKLLRQR